MEEPVVSEDPLSRQGRIYQYMHLSILSTIPITDSFNRFVSESLIVILLLFLALLVSALRAAFASALAMEFRWERMGSSSAFMLDRDQLLTFSVVQRMIILIAFLLGAWIFWVFPEKTDTTMNVGIPIVILLLWLWMDAVVRYIASHNAQVITRTVTPVIKPVVKMLAPVTKGLLLFSTRTGIIEKESAAETADRLEAESESEEERDLLRGLATFGQKTARKAMKPRMEITAFDKELNFHELMDKINKSGYSRVPVYNHTLDDVEGILYVKDLLPHLHKDEHFNWQKLLRQAYLIPESKRLDDLLQEFQNRRVHMAVVIDEYGGTCGLITLEDIIEEIFGDINDEYDDEEEVNFTQVDEKTFIFEGKVLISDFCRILDLEPDYFGDARGSSESLAGLMLELFSRLPRTGEQISFGDLTLKVQSADKKSIKKVRVLLN